MKEFDRRHVLRARTLTGGDPETRGMQILRQAALARQIKTAPWRRFDFYLSGFGCFGILFEAVAMLENTGKCPAMLAFQLEFFA